MIVVYIVCFYVVYSIYGSYIVNLTPFLGQEFV